MAEIGKPTEISLDGNALVRSLVKAGLDPKKLDLKEIFGGDGNDLLRCQPCLDFVELESRLDMGTAARGRDWEVNIKSHKTG